MIVVMMIGIRRRSVKESIGAITLNPIGSGSPGSLSRESKAGNSVMLPTYATIMPTPAISPSSENPP